MGGGGGAARAAAIVDDWMGCDFIGNCVGGARADDAVAVLVDADAGTGAPFGGEMVPERSLLAGAALAVFAFDFANEPREKGCTKAKERGVSVCIRDTFACMVRRKTRKKGRRYEVKRGRDKAESRSTTNQRKRKWEERKESEQPNRIHK
jgi:hypothetical protein